VLVLAPEDLYAECAELGARSVGRLPFAQLRYSVMHGNGNVILVVDEALSGISDRQVGSDLAREVCQSFRSVRVDGIAFVRVDGPAVRMTYFERDGTHSQMCGNALRCVTRYGSDRGYLAVDTDLVLTDDGPKRVSARDGVVRVGLGAGREFQQVAPDRYFVFSGLPHLVLLVDQDADLDAVDVQTEGARLRWDAALCQRLGHPEGLHVDFVQRDSVGIRVRTYEVGVEAETLACGTGVGGSAYVAHRVWDLPYPIRVTVRGGEMQVDEAAEGLSISGVVEYLFTNVDP
jgi:diaminopimelate epimerase